MKTESDYSIISNVINVKKEYFPSGNKTDYNHIGVLVPPEIQIQDKKDVITRILENYSIPYEYNEAEQVFVIYGYK